jgi:hypothetical protein
MSAVAATEFVRTLLLRRANQEHQNAAVPVTVTELPSRLFPLQRKIQKSDHDSTSQNGVMSAKSPYE